MNQERRCVDCGQPATVGLNGAWVCLLDFNNRMIAEAEKLRKLAGVAKVKKP